MADAGLNPTTSYKAKGEQIDGSFVLDGRVILLEAKWTDDPLPASAIYAFKGKVDGKLTGTIGFMIAVNGFSDDAHDALRFGKELNVLLMDGADLDVAFDRDITWAMRTKLRAAAEVGTAYYNLKPITGSVRTPRLEAPGTVSGSSGPRLLEFIVESRTDAIIVRTLAKRILEKRGDYNLIVQIAGGKLNIPTIANGSEVDSNNRSFASFPSRQIVVADGDGEPELTRSNIDQGLERPAHVIVIEPSIEQWFADAGHELSTENLRHIARTKGGSLEKLIGTLDLEILRGRSTSFRDFESALIEPSKPKQSRGPKV